MDVLLSPSFGHDKLENPSFVDLVDVFEDVWHHYVFIPCQHLLATPHGEVATMTLLSSYFEAIAGYVTGLTTDGRSKAAFVEGFCMVFASSTAGIEKAAEAVYKNIRCGLAHEGMLRHKVHYSCDCANAFLLTYRKNQDATLNTDEPPASIIVNPPKMLDGIQRHFHDYIRSLREDRNDELREAFESTVKRQWALGKAENIVGCTEEEFLGRT